MATKVKKEKSETNKQFAVGGKSNHMFGEQGANPQKAGTTAHDASAGPGADFAKGGGGKMFGFQGSQPAQAGKTSAR